MYKNCGCFYGACDCGGPVTYYYKVYYNNKNYKYKRSSMYFTSFYNAKYWMLYTYETQPKHLQKPRLIKLKHPKIV